MNPIIKNLTIEFTTGHIVTQDDEYGQSEYRRIGSGLIEAADQGGEEWYPFHRWTDEEIAEHNGDAAMCLERDLYDLVAKAFELITPDEPVHSEEHIIGAIRQVKAHCDLLMQNYELISLRGALYTLGYEEQFADAVIGYCAAHGFSYCIDPIIKCAGIGISIPERPSMDVCTWGPDQLKSRLEFVR